METAPYAEKMTAFQKMALQNVKSGLNLVQTQTDEILNQMLNQAHWIPEEYRSPIKKWQKFSVRELDLTTAFMDDVFLAYESIFSRPKKKAASRTKATPKKEFVTEKPKMEDKNES
jgi:hypothetical protein